MHPPVTRQGGMFGAQSPEMQQDAMYGRQDVQQADGQVSVGSQSVRWRMSDMLLTGSLFAGLASVMLINTESGYTGDESVMMSSVGSSCVLFFLALAAAFLGMVRLSEEGGSAALCSRVAVYILTPLALVATIVWAAGMSWSATEMGDGQVARSTKLMVSGLISYGMLTSFCLGAMVLALLQGWESTGRIVPLIYYFAMVLYEGLTGIGFPAVLISAATSYYTPPGMAGMEAQVAGASIALLALLGLMVTSSIMVCGSQKLRLPQVCCCVLLAIGVVVEEAGRIDLTAQLSSIPSASGSAANALIGYAHVCTAVSVIIAALTTCCVDSPSSNRANHTAQQSYQRADESTELGAERVDVPLGAAPTQRERVPVVQAADPTTLNKSALLVTCIAMMCWAVCDLVSQAVGPDTTWQPQNVISGAGVMVLGLIGHLVVMCIKLCCDSDSTAWKVVAYVSTGVVVCGYIVWCVGTFAYVGDSDDTTAGWLDAVGNATGMLFMLIGMFIGVIGLLHGARITSPLAAGFWCFGLTVYHAVATCGGRDEMPDYISLDPMEMYLVFLPGLDMLRAGGGAMAVVAFFQMVPVLLPLCSSMRFPTIVSVLNGMAFLATLFALAGRGILLHGAFDVLSSLDKSRLISDCLTELLLMAAMVLLCRGAVRAPQADDLPCRPQQAYHYIQHGGAVYGAQYPPRTAQPSHFQQQAQLSRQQHQQQLEQIDRNRQHQLEEQQRQLQRLQLQNQQEMLQLQQQQFQQQMSQLQQRTFGTQPNPAAQYVPPQVSPAVQQQAVEQQPAFGVQPVVPQQYVPPQVSPAVNEPPSAAQPHDSLVNEGPTVDQQEALVAVQ